MRLSAERGAMRLEAEVVPMGADLCVVVTGGERPHLGSAALGTPHANITDGVSPSATVSVLNLTGHRDGVLAERMCKRLSAALGRHVLVACGVHTDGLGAGGIADAVDAAQALTEQIVERFGQIARAL